LYVFEGQKSKPDFLQSKQKCCFFATRVLDNLPSRARAITLTLIGFQMLGCTDGVALVGGSGSKSAKPAGIFAEFRGCRPANLPLHRYGRRSWGRRSYGLWRAKDPVFPFL